MRGEQISDAALCEAFARVDHARGENTLTYFEFGTLAALLIFQQRSVDIAVLEVGMGGRLDAVNAVDCRAALITSIAIERVIGDKTIVERRRSGSRSGSSYTPMRLFLSFR